MKMSENIYSTIESENRIQCDCNIIILKYYFMDTCILPLFVYEQYMARTIIRIHLKFLIQFHCMGVCTYIMASYIATCKQRSVVWVVNQSNSSYNQGLAYKGNSI